MRCRILLLRVDRVFCHDTDHFIIIVSFSLANLPKIWNNQCQIAVRHTKNNVRWIVVWLSVFDYLAESSGMKYLIKGIRKASGEQVRVAVIARDQEHAVDQAVVLGIVVVDIIGVDQVKLPEARQPAVAKRRLTSVVVLLTVMVIGLVFFIEMIWK
jgi:hypothetical protein